MNRKQIDEILDDIGFIGGGRPLTEEDTKEISAWIQARKKQKQQAKKNSRSSTRKKTRKTT